MKQLCLGLVTAPKLYQKNKKVPQRNKKFDFIIREIWYAPLGNFTKMKGMLVYFQRQNASTVAVSTIQNQPIKSLSSLGAENCPETSLFIRQRTKKGGKGC